MVAQYRSAQDALREFMNCILFYMVTDTQDQERDIVQLHPITISTSTHNRAFSLEIRLPCVSSRIPRGFRTSADRECKFVHHGCNNKALRLCYQYTELGQGAHLSLAMYPLLALGVWHVTMTTGAQAQLPHVSQLYQSLKQALALLQTKHEAEIEYLQWALSIAVYEVDRGLALPAFHTLSGCKSVLTMLGYDALDSGNE